MHEMKLYENIPFDAFPMQINYYKGNQKCEFRPHWHEQMELLYIVKGNISVQCEEKIIDAKAGDCIIINGNELHEGVGGQADYLALNIPRSMMGAQNVKYKQIVSDHGIGELAYKIIYEHTHRDEASDFAITGYINLIIAILNRRYILKKYDTEGHNIYSKKTVMLNRVIGYLEDNYSEPLTLQEISEFAKVTKSYLCKEFRQYTGKTVNEYINYLRCIKAKEFLISTNISIADISCICGFYDPNYFARKFRQIMGKTPSNMRKENTVATEQEKKELYYEEAYLT